MTEPVGHPGRGPLPEIIQGGMGVAVSSWRLARAVSQTGQLGVASGTALEVVLARRLQDGDVDGDVRRALAHFPVPALADRVVRRYFRCGGRPNGEPYKATPQLTLRPSARAMELSLVANFAEVWLSKEGHDGPVGINFLEKIQMATATAAYGAMLADVDYVTGSPGAWPTCSNSCTRRRVPGARGRSLTLGSRRYERIVDHAVDGCMVP